MFGEELSCFTGSSKEGSVFLPNVKFPMQICLPFPVLSDDFFTRRDINSLGAVTAKRDESACSFLKYKLEKNVHGNVAYCILL